MIPLAKSRQIKNFQLQKENLPGVSVLMPIRNEADFIERSLGAVLLQDYPSGCMEILVVDGMSSDSTLELIKALDNDYPDIHVTILDNPEQIVPPAMNIGICAVQGDIIVRVDGHTTIAPDYIRQCVAALQSTDADNVGGRMNAVGENYFGEVVAVATSSPFGVGGGRFHYSDQEEWVDTVYMGAWRRDIFDRIGLFDEQLVRDQDDEFNYRLRARGGKILLSPKIKSTYTVRGTPGKLWKQYFQYGYWKVRVLQKHPRQMRPRQFVPPLFVLSMLVSLVLAILSFAHRTPHVAPLNLILGTWYLIPGLYLLANLAASIYTAAKRGWRSLPLLPIVYAILHLSYGSGFLVGLIRFAHRWGDKQGQVPSCDLSTSPSE